MSPPPAESDLVFRAVAKRDHTVLSIFDRSSGDLVCSVSLPPSECALLLEQLIPTIINGLQGK